MEFRFKYNGLYIVYIFWVLCFNLLRYKENGLLMWMRVECYLGFSLVGWCWFGNRLSKIEY